MSHTLNAPGRPQPAPSRHLVLGDGVVIFPEEALIPALQGARSAAEAMSMLSCRRCGPSADAIAYAFVEAAKACPDELIWLAGFADRVLQGRRACRSRWIAAAALVDVYGERNMAFLLKGWSERPIGAVLRGQAVQGWWDADLRKRIVAGLRFRFGG